MPDKSVKKVIVEMFEDYFWENMVAFSRDYLKYHKEDSKEICDALEEFGIHLDEAYKNYLNNNINIEGEVTNE